MTLVEQNHSLKLIALAWQVGKLVSTEPLSDFSQTASEVTILHTNDFHSSIDGRLGNGRPGSEGEIAGGIAKIATTIKQAKAAGATLALDAGDSVFGYGTWWDANGATTTARLRGASGYDLAAIGNHDLEHGLESLKELIEGGYPFVAANLEFTDEYLTERVRPAYIAEIAGWRIGITGATTPSTLHLVPSRMLEGVTLTDPLEALTTTIKALEPLVDTIIIISHLGFTGYGLGDKELAPYLAGTKVSVILGGHTHEALDPAPVIAGIVVCNAGAYGVNVNEVRLQRGTNGAVEVRARFLPQDATVAEDTIVADLRQQLATAFQPLHNTVFTVPDLPTLENAAFTLPTGQIMSREREWILVARALRDTLNLGAEAIVMLPILYVLGQLPPNGTAVTLAELVSAYPNIEHLVIAELRGSKLKEVMQKQSALLFYQQARPIGVLSEALVTPEQLNDNATYKIIITELVAEGGLGWDFITGGLESITQLDYTTSQLVTSYLQAGRLQTV